MGNFSIYRNTNLLRPRSSFSTLIKRRNGNAVPEIVRYLYFGTSINYGGILKRWTGSIWAKAKLMTYKNGGWVNNSLKIFKAGTWQYIDKI
jgi:hypothetical protein